MQNAAAALVPTFRAKEGDEGARKCADRLLGWSTLMGCMLGLGQFLLLPVLVPLFSTLDDVQEAVRVPSLIASLIHVVNGPVLAGEGIMMGVGSYKSLALITMSYIASMVTCLTCTPLGKRLDGIMWSILLSSIVQQVGVVGHYLKVGPLAVKKETTNKLRSRQKTGTIADSNISDATKT
jgi:Na+-driven multidrug efflux pump